MNEMEFYLEDLKSKFDKIDPEKYYLAYSGGRDSHFLLWFIREYLDEDRIPAVFSNTGMELPEIRSRGLGDYLKKKPGMKFEKETGRKPIKGIMGTESWRRKTKFTSCFNSKGHFTPLYDLTEDLRNRIEKEYEIPVPKVYDYVSQTGCAGCPYGQHGKNKFENTNLELFLCGDGQRKFILDYFKESYAHKGYTYEPRLFI